jgi:flavin-dependent dehydrogenase
MSLPDADVVVVGDGPAGCVAARLLAAKGWHVSLLSRPGRGAGRACEVLSPACAGAISGWLPHGLLDTVGVARRCAGIRSRWHHGGLHHQDYPGDSGYIIDRACFDGGLRNAAVAAGALLYPGFDLCTVERTSDAIVLRGHADRQPWSLRARFVVDASGRAATLARRLGCSHVRVARQVAFAARVFAEGAESQNAAGWFDVESGEAEWWTASTAPDGSRDYVYYSRPPRARQGGQSLVQKLLETRLVPPGGEPPRWAGGTDAGTTFARSVRGERWVAIGDAAAAFDPVSSQGIWNAVASAAAVAPAIGEFLMRGDLRGLERYEFRLSATLSHHLRGLRHHLGRGVSA